MNKKTIVFVLVLLASVSLAWAVRGFIASAEIGNERERARERLAAQEAGYVAAQEASKKVLLDKIRDYNVLQDAYDGLQEHVSGLTPQVVTRWQTKEIEVPVEKIVRVPVEKVVEIPGASPDCPLPETVSFSIHGADAHVESRKGNLFAVGQAELWRTEPPPETLLGVAAWEDELTEIASLRAYTRPWRATVLLGTSDLADIRLGLVWQRRSRFGLWFMGGYDPNPESRDFLSDYDGNYSFSADKFGVAGGVSLTLGRR